MLSIKLQRIGRRHQPSYRVVVAESRSKLIAPPVEDLGSYNPFTKNLSVKADRVKHWVSVGAQPTVTVHNLLAKGAIIEAKPRKIAMPAKDMAKVAEAEAKVAEKAAAAVARAEAEAAAKAEAEKPAQVEEVEEVVADEPAVEEETAATDEVAADETAVEETEA